MTTADFNQLSSLSDLVQEWRVRNEERARATHSNFNVFTTVLKANDEVRLHTRFIHNLLNPLGTHDCGELFLSLFFDSLKEAPKDFQSDSFEVRKEAITAQGQIDLLLESSEMGIAIENKIDAVEQPRQLARYAKYLEDNYPENNLLIYLTLDGKESYTHEGADYLRISYRDHILPWLDSCLSATFSIIPVNQVLLQYRHLVRTLTGRTLEHQAMKDIADHLVANPNLIRMRADFNAGVEEVKARALDLLAESLIAELPPDYPGKLRANFIDNRFGKDPLGSIRLSPASGPFAATRYQIVILHFAKRSALVIGIESKWNIGESTKKEASTLAVLDELLCVESEENEVHKADPLAPWHGEMWPVGYHNLEHPWVMTDNVIADFFDLKKRTEFAKELISRAMIYVKLLEQLHEQAETNPVL
ncbi:MAG: PD-(D/E)XK nuclease family protein [Roseibacillus sp.]